MRRALRRAGRGRGTARNRPERESDGRNLLGGPKQPPWVISNPGSIPELIHHAEWLSAQGQPVVYCAPLFVRTRTLTLLRSAHLPGRARERLVSLLTTRAIRLQSTAEGRHYGWLTELAYLATRSRAPRLAGWIRDIHVRYFDWRVSVVLPANARGVLGRHTASRRTFHAAACRGIATVLDYSIIHHGALRLIQKEENKRYPALASSFQEAPASLRKEAVLDEEVALATAILTFSPAHARSMLDQGVPNERVLVVPLGVDLTLFPYHERHTRLPETPFRILFVGQITQRKGIGDLLDCFALLPIGEFELTLVGTVKGRIQPQLEKRGVTVLPPVPRHKLSTVYRDADAFVFLSTAEGFPQTPLEAMASGLPVICSKQAYGEGGPITDGVDGILVDARDHERVARHLQWLSEDASRGAELGRRAARRARDFTWDRFSSDLHASLIALR